MHSPHRDELAQFDRINDIVVPEAYGEDSGVVSELDFKETLGGFVLLAGAGDGVEVYDAACETEVSGTGL